MSDIIDGHVTVGKGREVSLDGTSLLDTLERLGIAGALMAPAESYVAVRNREGHELLAGIARRSGGRLNWYGCANPWFGRDAIAALSDAARDGASALKIDPTLQGFDLLDGIIDPLVGFAIARGWPIYCRTGTPVHALPLQLAELAIRFPEGHFIMGRNGATDFWLDVIPALHRAPNLFADTAYAFVDDPLIPLMRDPAIGARRIVFTSDSPYSDIDLELAKFDALPTSCRDRTQILGTNLLSLLDGVPPS